MSLAKRSVTSVAWNSVANLATVAILFVRTVTLARLVPVEIFGSYGVANVIVSLSVVVVNFGMGGAFVHRTKESQNEKETAAVYFTLLLFFGLVWAACLLLGATIWSEGDVRIALYVLTIAYFLMQMTAVPRLILIRRVAHRRIALMQVLTAISTTSLALIFWKLNFISIWTLLVLDAVTALVMVIILFVWRPVWRVQLRWDRPVVKYMLSFGSRNFFSVGLLQILDYVDDLWTSIFLGKNPLAYYNRAFTIATYPRRILASAVNSVATGTYAELKEDRRRLSQSFFRANALLVRSGFLLAGIMALVAPEFIRLVLGEKWLPMLTTFRLMLVFTMLDPIKLTIANLLVAVGKPERIAAARGLQLLTLLVGLFALGPRWGISGVAVAVDLMLLVGLVALLRECRPYVDFSVKRLFLIPLVALAIAMLLGRAAILMPGVMGSDWRTGGVKLAVFLAVYGLIMVSGERQETMAMLKYLIAALWKRPGRKRVSKD